MLFLVSIMACYKKNKKTTVFAVAEKVVFIPDEGQGRGMPDNTGRATNIASPVLKKIFTSSLYTNC